MAKRFLRRSFPKKRFTKKTTSLARVFNTIPRSLFPPMPQQMTVALDFCQEFQGQTGAGLYTVQQITLHLPTLLDGQLPGYFSALMRIYSRAYCEKAYVDISMMGIAEGDIMAVTWATITLQDAQQVAANLNAASMNLIRSAIGSKATFMPGSNSTGPLRITQWLDTSKSGNALSMRGDNYYSTSNGQVPPIIFLPIAANIPFSPTLCIMQHNNTPDNSDWSAHRRVTYHLRFSNPHFGQTGL